MREKAAQENSVRVTTLCHTVSAEPVPRNIFFVRKFFGTTGFISYWDCTCRACCMKHPDILSFFIADFCDVTLDKFLLLVILFVVHHQKVSMNQYQDLSLIACLAARCVTLMLYDSRTGVRVVGRAAGSDRSSNHVGRAGFAQRETGVSTRHHQVEEKALVIAGTLRCQ